jgi:type I restriction enzyme R subunit
VKPEDRARERIDEALAQAGWTLQDSKAVNIHAARGVAMREFLLKGLRTASRAGKPVL